VDIRTLAWSEVGGDAVSLRQKKTKQRQRFVTNEALESVFASARQRPVLGLYVIATDKGQPVSEYMMQVAWRDACKAAGVKDAQFRDIRPMAAKAAEDDGQDIQKLLGHTTRAMSEKYLKGTRTVNVEPIRRKL
jgi:integrase